MCSDTEFRKIPSDGRYGMEWYKEEWQDTIRLVRKLGGV